MGLFFFQPCSTGIDFSARLCGSSARLCD